MTHRASWAKHDLATHRKNNPVKLAMAARLREETTFTLKEIAALTHLGTSKSANARLHEWMSNSKPGSRRK